jgi:ribose transport system substrate-binding protein
MLIRRVAIALSTCLIAGVAAGCSSSAGSSAAPTNRASGSAASDTAQAQAEGLLARIMKTPTEPPGLIKLSKPPAKGKQIAFVTCGAQPQCQVYSSFMQQATNALGWHLRVYQGGATPEATTNVMNQVVQAAPDGVIAVALPKSEVTAQLAQLKAKNTPFIDIFDNDPPGGGLTQTVDGSTQFVSQEGAWAADSVIALGGSKANTLFITSSDFPVLNTVTTGFDAEYKKLCGSCGLHQLNIAATDIGAPTVNTQIVSFLSSHPGYQYVVPVISDLAIGLPAALAQAGISGISLTTASANSTALSGIESGSSPWKGGLMTPSEVGLAGVNLIVDYLAKQPTTTDEYPMQFITKDNVPGNIQTPVVIPNALQLYKAAWGLS